MTTITRRHLLGTAGLGGLALLTRPAWSAAAVDLLLPGGPDARPVTTAFPQKGAMILQRTRPPLLETPFEVFDKGTFTPNDQFYVRWHWAVIPTAVDAPSFRLNVRGHVNQALSLSLADILNGFPRVELAAVNQCSGNSRGLFQPRVPGGQWANGAMGNALWAGVRLKDVLDRAGIKVGAVQVRFTGLDQPVVPGAPRFMKSLAIDHATDGEVMIAYEMNGEQLPLVNGFPLRLVVPGWYSTYWIKMLNDIEVLDQADTNFWMATAYTIPDTPHADMKPGETGVQMVPINRMVPRSFITNLRGGDSLPAGASQRYAASRLAAIAVWRASMFRSTAARPGIQPNSARTRESMASGSGAPSLRHSLQGGTASWFGVAQPLTPNWNSSGFMRNVIESTDVVVG